MNRLLFTLLFLITCIQQTIGQTHDWAFDIINVGGVSDINAQTVDDSSNIFIGGRFRGTMYIGTDTFTFTSATRFAIFIAKYDEDGNYIWGKAFTTAQNANLADLKINSQGQILLFGNYNNGTTGSITFGNTTLSQTNGVFVAFMNSTGTFTDARDLGYGSFTTALSIALGKNDEILVAMYLNGFGVGWNIVNGNSGTGFVNVIAQFNKTASSVNWSKEYSINDVPTINDVTVDRFNQVYFSCRAANNKSLFGKTTPSSGAACFLVWLRPNGDLKSSLLGVSNSSLSNSIVQVEAIDSSAVYILGYSYSDSIVFENSTIYSLTSSTNTPFNWIAQVTNLDTLTWSVSTSRSATNAVGVLRLSLNGDFLYMSSLQNTSGFSIGGFSTSNFTASVVSKLDRLGNVLWYLPINAVTAPILSGIGSQDLVYSGGYTGSLSLSPFTLSNTTGTRRPFIARTYDYSITRGAVRDGPYCAGDTLLVPYDKVGDFDTSNFFIAELSDEEGNFLGGQRELGRLKSTKDSTVIGLLPLFQVASSGQYRIRITSTSPVVQSYYKLDTLNLLIYSRDNADPGPDTSLCLGDTLQLFTFGGTKWTWYPQYAMNDSTLRNPKVWPREDTVYQIIIGDSSGCGLADTADIRVRIRALPEFVSQSQSDTLVCKDAPVVLRNSFSGGINNFYVFWYGQNGSLIQTNKPSTNQDSLLVAPTANSRYFAVLTDSCADYLDTVFYEVAIFDTMTVFPRFQDTLICYGQEVELAASAFHPRMDSISFAWKEIGNQLLVSTDSQFRQNFVKKTMYELVVQNTCNQESKQFLFEVDVHPPLSNSLIEQNGRNILCSGDTLIFMSNVTGGVSPNSLQTIWEFEGVKSSRDSLFIFADSLYLLFPGKQNFTLTNTAEDGCTIPNDTAYYSFTLIPELEINQLIGLDTVLCANRDQVLELDVSGGLGDTAYVRKWRWNNSLLASTDSFILSASTFSSGQLQNMVALVEDGCSNSDSIGFQFLIPNPPLVYILGMDTTLCNGSFAAWKSIASGGIPSNFVYTWQINGQTVSITDSFDSVFTHEKVSSDSTLWLSLTLSDGCALAPSSDSIFIQIKANPIASFGSDSMMRNQFSDTLICRGEEIVLNPRVFNQLFAPQALLYENGVLVNSSGNFIQKNTDKYPGDSLVYMAVIQAGCGTKTDTAVKVIRLRKALQLQSISDSVVCANTTVRFFAIPEGGLSSNYNFQWSELPTRTIIGTDSFLDLQNIAQPFTLGLKLTDGCTLIEDSISFEVSSLAPLSIQLDASAICADTIELTALGQGGKPNVYSYSWFRNGIPQAQTQSSLFLYPNEINWIKVELSDGCSGLLAADSLRISERVKFTESDAPDSVCAPFETNWDIQAQGNTPVEIRWSELPVLSWKPSSVQAVYPASDYQFVFLAENELGCQSIIQQNVRVKPIPSVDFSWSPDAIDDENSRVTLTAEKASDFISWYVNDEFIQANQNSVTYEFKDTGNYRVKLIRSEGGCTDSLEQIVRVNEAFESYNVSAFSPNGDGLNDTYRPFVRGEIDRMEYQIFNSWGQKVYEGDQQSPGWDGNFRGEPVPSGHYLVILVVQAKDGRRFNKSTTLFVIR